MTSTVPLALYRSILASGLTATVAELAIVWPGTRLRVAALGCGEPCGATVTTVLTEALVPVRFSTTAVAVGGISPDRSTVRAPEPTGEDVRVSMARDGEIVLNVAVAVG